MEKSNEKEKLQDDGTSGIWEDSRFSHLVSDPRFKNLPNFQRKVKIDKRFQSMFSDKKFKVKYTVDKYGRKVNQSTTEDLKKYYDLESSAEEEDEENEEIEKREEELAIARDDDEERSRKTRIASGSDIDETDVKDVPKSLREKLIDPEIDYARGEGALLTDSSLDDESSEDEDAELYIEHVWGEIDNDAETTDESTRRLAVCNMDWDRIRAQDIMVVCSSFVPPGGSILSVKIYTSEYGKKRLAEEEKHGPQELVQSSKEQKKQKESNVSDSEEEEEDLVQEQDSEAEEGDEYHMEKLRQYQLNRLRYYYAVIECDCVTTADKLYKECDGLEYESTATKLDLRFIPEDTTFDEEEPKDVCTEMPDLNQYKPRSFTTTALQQAKVNLTWDETSIERKELGEKLTTGKLEEINDAELRKFVAYSSEEDNEDEASDKDKRQENEANKTEAEQIQDDKPKNGKNTKETISKYKALLLEIEEKEKKEKKNKLEMEFSWDINAENSEKEEQEIENAASNLTPIEKVLKKRSEKNKKRKEDRKKRKREAAGKDEIGDDDSDSDIPDDIDMNDPYFAEEFANGEFIQPKSKKDKLKKKKKNAKNQEDADDEEVVRKEQELQLLLDDSNENDVGKKHFSLEKIIEAENETKSKRRRKKQLKKSKLAQIKVNQNDEFDDNFSINVDDKRFAAIYSSHLFNIDPTDSHYKKTKGMQTLIHEKLKRRHGDDDAAGDNRQTEEEIAQMKKPKKQIENSILAKSIKRKILNKSN